MVLLGLLLVFCIGAVNAQFCVPTQPQPSPVKLPTIPNKFWVSVEAKFLNSKRTIDLFEYYDDSSKVGSVFITGKGQRQRVIYNYNTQQAIVLDTSGRNFFLPGVCKVYDMARYKDNFLMGGGVSTDGSIRLVGPSAVFKFSDNVNKVYVGEETVRNVPTNHWSSCYYWKIIDATIKIDWWFSKPGAWNYAVNITEAPVRISVDGRYGPNGPRPNQAFKHIYDVIRFRQRFTSDDRSNFQVPRGYICDGVKSTKKVPNTPDRLTIRIESSNPELRETSYSFEEYDFPANLSRVIYTPTVLDPNRFRYGPGSLTVIHDYLRGVEYVTNNQLGNCSYGPIPKISYDSKTLKENPQLVRMRTPNEFFRTDKYPSYYKGKRTIRGMEADVFLIRRQDWPQPIASEIRGLNSSFELGFRTIRYKDQNGNSMERTGNLIWMEINSELLGYHTIDNVFDYDVKIFSSRNFDISSCFENHAQRHFSMILDVTTNQKAKILQELNNMKDSFVLSAAASSQVSPLRIANIDIYVDAANQLTAEFSLLDRGTIKGDVKDVMEETPLDEAVANLVNTVKDGKFTVIFIPADKMVFGVSPEDNSFFEIQRLSSRVKVSQGYTPGIVVVVALVTLVFGFLLGAGILVVLYYVRGRTLNGVLDQFKPQRFQ